MKTLAGGIVHERAYYYCRECRSGYFPTDEEFGIRQKQSPAAAEVITLTGVLQPFAEGADDVLPRLTGLNVSASSMQRTTEAVGDDIAARRAADETIGPETPWEWNRDATGTSVACVGLDATGVRQQGAQPGEKAEGRMAWVATVFNPDLSAEDRRERVETSRYVSGLMSLPEIGGQLRRECRAVGLERAGRVIALTDGGGGLEDCLTDAVAGLAAETVFILDFWHASQHLQEFANLFVADEDRRRRQMESWLHLLKREGGESLLAELESLDLERASPAVREEHRRLCGYVRNNLHRMDYPRYVSHGWPIGSGKVESACKGVVAQRLKGRGMRWRSRGTTAMCQLRALYRSEPALWQHYWSHLTAP